MSEPNKLEYGLYDDPDLTVTLTLDDDAELACLIVALFPVLSKDYIALYPMDENYNEIFLYRFSCDDSGEIALENIEDDAEFNLVAAAYDTLIEEAEE